MSDRGARLTGYTGIKGDFVNGDAYTIEQLVIHIHPDGGTPKLDEEALQALRRDYLDYLASGFRHLDFKGINIPEMVANASGLELEAVYVPVRARRELPEGETWQRIAGRDWLGDEAAEALREARAEAEEGTVEAALERHAALVVLGDPGSGKSTLMKRLALGLAERAEGPLPILIPLNAYGKALERDSLSLNAFLAAYYRERQGRLARLDELFHAALAQGRAVVLLDGLDEVGENRGELVARVEAFLRAHLPEREGKGTGGNRLVVTSRFVGYREHPLNSARWATYALVDWDRERIAAFVERFTLAAERAWGKDKEAAAIAADAERERSELLAAVTAHDGIARLAGNPLLLTILALIKRQGVTLPHRRVELYRLYLETLLNTWHRARGVDGAPVGPEIDPIPTQRLLAKLALHLRDHNPRSGLIGEEALHDFLEAYFKEEEGLNGREAREEVRGFLASVRRYSNLLLERGRGQYGFIHLTFEEYLAGFGLSLLKDKPLLERIMAALDDPRWHESLQLALGVIAVVKMDQERVAELLTTLAEGQAEGAARGLDVLLAGRVLADLGAGAVGRRAAARVGEALERCMQTRELPNKPRREAGLLLGEIGRLPEDLDRFLPVPAGPFPYGDKKEERCIETPYWIAKYPVTNAQYRRFMEAGGYEERRWWSKEGWRWREKEGLTAPRFWWESELANPASPVVGVSRFEAQAYARWLEGEVGAAPERFALPEAAWRVRLPSEEEWERAARGDDGREYPWGDGFEGWRANTREGEAGGTSAVHAFPGGESPVGAREMAGNVWEWTASDEEGRGVLRGGSWLYFEWYARCAPRNRLRPGVRDDYVGFRVVVSPADSVC
ncbi:NACHT domain-containing protein [Endothiovibrio diazotrophicus]